MNALVKKEIRLLLPSFVIALVLAVSVWLIPTESNPEQGFWAWLLLLPLLFCPALVVMTALDSFGREISAGTFANLLAQPVSRLRIWRTKVFLLAMALLIVLGVWWMSLLLHEPLPLNVKSEDLHELFTTAILFVATAYSGGLFSVLLFRQVGAAFWFTVLVPAGLAMLTFFLTDMVGGSTHAEAILILVLGAYSVAGFAWAQRLFLRAQDVQWTGGEITLPAWVKLPRMFRPSARPVGSHPRRALIKKELQLHQSQFVIAGVLALIHLVLIVVRNTYGNLRESPTLEFVAFQFWALWLVLPLLIGCTAVAEERKLGTLEGQLCLPARRRTQFLIKFGVALALALLFGVVVPLLFEGGRILPDFSETFTRLLDNPNIPFGRRILSATAIEILSPLFPLFSLLPLFLIAVSFLALSFYASTLSRNTLHAIGPAILGILITWTLLLGAGSIQDLVHFPLWRGWLIYLIGIPVLTCVMGWLTYCNFRNVLVGWPVWRRNLTVSFSTLTFVIVATTAIYQRAWELILPLEPAHGPARWAATDAVRMSNDSLRLSVQFADGRVWSTRLLYNIGGFSEMLSSDRQMEAWPGGGFLEGTNWSNVVFCPRDVMALSRDGSLWVSEEPENLRELWLNGKPRQPEAIKLVRYGDDSNWKSIVGRGMSVFALKNDGTLCRIGNYRFDARIPWPGLRSFAPQRVGTNSDWAELSVCYNWLVLANSNGLVYVHPPTTAKPKEAILLDDNMPAERFPTMEKQRWRGMAWASSRRSGAFLVGVTEDGRFCVTSDYQLRNGQYEMVMRHIQIGSDTNWLAVAADYQTVTLKADGTLWAWDFLDNLTKDPDSARATRLGTHSDWRAVVHSAGGVVSLAADGSLWQWRFDVRNAKVTSPPPLLRPTRRPQLITNIFDDQQ